jgi:hypothetical protein
MDKNVDKFDCHTLPVELWNDIVNTEKSLVTQNLNIVIPYYPAIPFLHV